MAEPGRRRILLVTRNLPPLIGGMERLNWHLADALARHAEVRVIGPARSAALAPPQVSVSEVPLTPLWRFLLAAMRQARRQARQWRPHWVVAGSGLTAPVALLAARTCAAETAVYLHGLDISVDNRIYRSLWLPAIRRMHRVLVNSSPTRVLALNAGIDASRIEVLHPGTDLPDTLAGTDAVRAFRRRHALEPGPVLLSVGRLTRRKGLRAFVRDVLPAVARTHPGVRLLIVGDAPADALHAQEDSRADLQAEADAVGVGERLVFHGRASEQELGLAYQAADLHVFPVQSRPDDPEGFGMVAIEAAAYGTPTAAYASGGVVDAVADGVSGRLVAPGDAMGLANAINELLDTRMDRAGLHRHAEAHSWHRFEEQLVTLLRPPNDPRPA